GQRPQQAPAEPEAEAEAEPSATEAEPEPSAAEPEPEPSAAEQGRLQVEQTAQAEPRAEEAPERGGDGGPSTVLSPVVRRLLKEHDLDPAQIEGTGQGGRITRADVLAFIDTG